MGKKPKAGAEAREARLKAALRANLKRRKDQSRARGVGKKESAQRADQSERTGE